MTHVRELVAQLGPVRDRQGRSRRVDAFRQGLRERGCVESQNIVIECRAADGKSERLPGLATELARLKVDLIVAPSSPVAHAVRHATTTIPIVAGGRRWAMRSERGARELVELGALMAYGASINDLYRRSATYKFELIINFKTARALGLKIPESLLLRADQVIQ